jgi:hypothetical protein
MPFQFSNTACVGMRFRDPAEQSVAGALLPGDIVTLERDPFNQHDTNAIKVIYSDHHIGYIAREPASFIASYMDDGISFTGAVTGRAKGAIILDVTSAD